MALDHSRLGLENKFLENKSGRIFLAFDGFTLQILANKSEGVQVILFIHNTSEIHSTMRRCFVFTDLAQILLFFAVFKPPQICWQEFVK